MQVRWASHLSRKRKVRLRVPESWNPPWAKVVKRETPSLRSETKKNHEDEDIPTPAAVIDEKDLGLEPIEVPNQPEVPPLANNLDRVLFSPGVHFIKDPRTNVYNFDPRLGEVVSIKDFDFGTVAPYIPSGKDVKLAELTSQKGKKYFGSTSSLTPILNQLHHAISNNRPPQIMSLPKYFPGYVTTFTKTQRAPISMFLRKMPNANVWTIDQGTVPGESNDLIVSLLGHALEAKLTTPASVFRYFTKDQSHLLDKDDKNLESTYNYTACGNFLMRSQLDCFDPRLPGTGMFDLKTRAATAVRYDLDWAQIRDGSHYQILQRNGHYESFAREYYELIRSAMFKYSLQARIGRMDGIFIAYHNIRQIFGFEYVPLLEMDKIFHTAHLLSTPRARADPELEEKMAEIAPVIADSEFKLSLGALETILDHVLQRLPSSSLYDMVCHSPAPGELLVFAKPMQRLAQAEEEPTIEGYKEEKDPHTIIQHYTAHQWLPPDVVAFRVDLHSLVNEKRVPLSLFPIFSTQDSWRLEVTPKELTSAEAKIRLNETMAQLVSQVYVSSPVTERLDDDERRVADWLSQLPEASKLQTLLRRLEAKGEKYLQWDASRKKILLRPPQN